jgi:hypothetical protein
MKQQAIATVGALVLLASPAWAQGPYVQPGNPFYRPPFSPYLNLTLPGSPAVNYYGLIRPQLQQQTAIQQLQTEVLTPDLTGTQGYGTSAVLITGHASAFQNHWGYFQNWQGRTGTIAAGYGLTATPGLAGTTAVIAGTTTTAPRPATGGAGRSPMTLPNPMR